MPTTSINIYTLKLVKTTRRRYEVEDCKITCPLACYKAIQHLLDLKSEAVEKFGVITLNTKNHLAGIHIIASGGVNSANVDIANIFKAALLNNATAIIAFHNHPSGQPTPSPHDIALTKRIQTAGQLMNIRLLDHIITGEDGYVSLKEKGIL